MSAPQPPSVGLETDSFPNGTSGGRPYGCSYENVVVGVGVLDDPAGSADEECSCYKQIE